MAKHQSRRAVLSVGTFEDRCVPAVDAFIWFEAPDVEQVQSETRDAAFEIKDFSFGVENPTTIGSATGGAGAGKIKFNEFTIKKTSDSASPAFFTTKIDWSGPGDEGPEESITFVYGKLG